jgi:hypothetical protein
MRFQRYITQLLSRIERRLREQASKLKTYKLRYKFDRNYDYSARYVPERQNELYICQFGYLYLS